jgi:hypothetical protein
MKAFLVLSILGLAVAACSGADNKSEGNAGSGASAPATETASAKDAPSAAVVGPFTAGDQPRTPSPFEGSGGASGSGCAPGAGVLPDGAWFGHAVRWDAAGIDFDLACIYFGDPAVAEAATRKLEKPPNGFLIVNDGKVLRRVSVASGAIGYRLVDVGERIALERTTYASLIVDSGRYQPCPAEWCPVWVFINAGAASEVMQQYIP